MLSPDQRARIAQQRELALARRRQRIADRQPHCSLGLFKCSQAFDVHVPLVSACQRVTLDQVLDRYQEHDHIDEHLLTHSTEHCLDVGYGLEHEGSDDEKEQTCHDKEDESQEYQKHRHDCKEEYGQASQQKCHEKQELCHFCSDAGQSSCHGVLWELGEDDDTEGLNRGLVFSKQQLEVLKAVAKGKSIFMTGSAGTGKSYVLSHIMRLLKERYGKESVYVTASTGLAACALGGTTLHAFSGIGLGKDDRETLAAKVLGNKESRERWRQARVLIIDEISMIDGQLFDKLEYVATVVRGNKYQGKCFGGLQLIVTGDFFQLPPVKPLNPQKYFAFEADCWKKCFDMQIELQYVFRQCDEGFVEMLNEIRKGLCSLQTQQSLRACLHVLPDDGSGVMPTRLYPLKIDVKSKNEEELRSLGKETIRFTAHDKALKTFHRHLLDNVRFEKELDLCIGAQVMLLKNFDTAVGLVNGARGVVVGFDSLHQKANDRRQLDALSVSSTSKWPVVRFVDGFERVIGPETEVLELGGTEVASRLQVPLTLAWALSIHKCQGMTLDKVETDLSEAFEYGMVYVALSRVKSLDGLQLASFNPARIRAHPKVLAFGDKITGSKSV